MKPGLKIGDTYRFELTVEHGMRAHFNDETVHDLYGTPAMLMHMEWACRQHILPYLDDGEEGVGVQMQIHHLGPTPVGETVTIEARLTGLRRSKVTRVTSECRVWHGERLVGQGTIVQAVLPLEVLHGKIPAVSH